MCQHWRIATTSLAFVDQTVQPLPASQAVDTQLFFLQTVAEPWPSAEDGGEEGVQQMPCPVFPLSAPHQASYRIFI